MQDMHGGGGGGGGGGRFFGGGDRRLRPHNHLSHLANVKCPRCDSINTKFCYYNNYNLSQPRHFCKSCRRYWTKGGVLRNVPVGGGCRKAKRSKPKIAGAATTGDDELIESKSNAQSSSSESSSSLTAAAATATFPPSAATAVAEEGSAPSNTTSNSAVACNFTDSKLFNVNPQTDPNFDHQPLVNHPSTDGQIFSTEMGSFTSLMSSSEEMMVGFGMGDINPTTSYGGTQQVNQLAVVADKSGPGITGSAGAADEFKMHDVDHEGLTAALDWGNGGGGGDQELFDLTAGVDPAYWTQSQWTDNDHSLNYLP